MSQARILVLMTTYNGKRHVAEQIDSILAQQNVDVTLRISDDGSTDGTYDVLEEYAAEHDNVEISFNAENLGCSRNVMTMVYAADAKLYDFFAISDQDDVWLPDKLEVASVHITANTSRPELYYADVMNVDNGGNELGCEYRQYECCAEHPFSLLLVQNWCLGCTLLMNGALVRLLQEHPVFDFGRMYDAWIHAVALYCGGYVSEDLDHAYVRRRITGSNVVGIMNEERSKAYIARKAWHWFFHRDEEVSGKHTKLAECLYREYKREMEFDVAETVWAVATRRTSFKARRYLFHCKEIVMTTDIRTRWLHWMVLLNRF